MTTPAPLPVSPHPSLGPIPTPVPPPPMEHGVTSFLVDPNNGCCITPAWAKYLADLGIRSVRASISTAPDGSFPSDLYKRALDCYSGAGIRVIGVIHEGFTPVGSPAVPNAVMGLGGNPLLNAWIDRVTLRAEGAARQLVGHGLAEIIAGNEGNLLGLIKPGAPTPAPPSDKSAATSPEVWGALAWQMAHRLKGIVPVYVGALSFIPAGIPHWWNLDYLDRAYAMVERHAGHDYPWAGIVLNAEGWWHQDQTDRLIQLLGNVRDGRPGERDKPILIGECGMKQGAIGGTGIASMRASMGQLARFAARAYWFQAPGHSPYLGDPALYQDYGLHQWFQRGASFAVGAPYPWHDEYFRMVGESRRGA